AAGTLLAVPCVKIQVYPIARLRHEPLQEKRRDDGACERSGGDVAEIRDFARKLVVVSGPERQRPDWIGLLLSMAAQRIEQLFVRRVGGGQLRTERRARRAGQRCKIDEEVRP